MKRTSLIFKKPFEIELRQEPLSSPRKGEVLIKTQLSAISRGTEMLVYGGQFPSELPVDENIAALNHQFCYPLKYGYSSIGQVVEIGPAVEKTWLDRTVFCFHPHETHYIERQDYLIPVPPDIHPMDAAFLPSMETAVNLVMDGRPTIGESIVVFGQGVVGLLTTALLAQYPLGTLVTLDQSTIRRKKSQDVGAHCTIDPDVSDLQDDLTSMLEVGCGEKRADLIYEISGNPRALNQALNIAGFAARIVIGSWYGTKKTELELGGRFHRDRIGLISSQVSTLAPVFSGRWDKTRRLKVSWDMIRRLKPAHFVTQRIGFQRAKEAYELLDKRPHETIQVILTYED